MPLYAHVMYLYICTCTLIHRHTYVHVWTHTLKHAHTRNRLLQELTFTVLCTVRFFRRWHVGISGLPGYQAVRFLKANIHWTMCHRRLAEARVLQHILRSRWNLGLLGRLIVIEKIQWVSLWSWSLQSRFISARHRCGWSRRTSSSSTWAHVYISYIQSICNIYANFHMCSHSALIAHFKKLSYMWRHLCQDINIQLVFQMTACYFVLCTDPIYLAIILLINT